MKRFSDIVKEVSENFIREAKQSPQLLSDMAKMEYYMAESYSGRLFVELLQNADDAKSTRIISYYNNGNLYFANNGKPFDDSDLIAISRSGASDKQRGKTIGYRGIGFKSASSISNDIIIYSANTYFTFSKEKSSKILNMKTEDVPTIRIPVFLESVDNSISEDVELLKENGYSTVFIFKNVDIELYLEELKEIDDGYFIFLNSVYECAFDINGYEYKYEISRFADMSSEHIEVKSSDRTTEWMVCKNKNVAVSFLIEDGYIVPCDDKEAVYHCYLPTLESAYISCKINADFSTDPSRKHITMDDKTKDSLEQIGVLLGEIIELAFKEADSGKYKNILKMYMKKTTISKMNFFLDEIVEREITNKPWVKLENGECISPSEYKILPSSFNVEKPETVRTVPGEIANISLPQEVYKKIDGVESFMEQYASQTIPLETISKDLSDPEYVGNLNTETHTQLLTSALREAKIEEVLVPNATTQVQTYIVKTKDKQLETIENVVSNQEQLDPELQQELKDRLGGSEIRWIQEQVGSSDLIKQIEEPLCEKKQSESKKTDKGNVTIHIAKWRDAEVKCVMIEESMGNVATDVSLSNYGYDVVSKTPDGRTRYIEVKSVKKDFAFSLTNNEYTAAHQYGEDYYVCLLLEDDSKLVVRYIQDPLNNAKFEKRIKQWEWLCLECDSTSMEFDLEG